MFIRRFVGLDAVIPNGKILKVSPFGTMYHFGTIYKFDADIHFYLVRIKQHPVKSPPKHQPQNK